MVGASDDLQTGKKVNYSILVQIVILMDSSAVVEEEIMVVVPE